MKADSLTWLSIANPDFKLRTSFPSIARNQFHLTSVGLTPSLSEQGSVSKLIRKCVHRHSRRQELTLSALVASMRWLHDSYQPNSPIGPNMMAVSLPKAAAEEVEKTCRFVALSGQPNASTATFLDINASGRVEVFGPHVAYRGISMTGFTAEPIPDEPGNAA